MSRMVVGAIKLAMLLLVIGLTWLVTWPVRWLIYELGPWYGWLVLPPFGVICWLAWVWIDKPRR